jgi:enamine deaminase RidA (YjgF/YER057c/UK114 family)
MPHEQTHVPTNTPWATAFRYSRAVRSGARIEVSGTTALDKDGNVIAPGDAYAQTKAALAIIESALNELGATLDHVIRTRAFLRNVDDWADIGRAHAEAFPTNPPASSCVGGCELLLPELLVEIEASAQLPEQH